MTLRCKRKNTPTRTWHFLIGVISYCLFFTCLALYTQQKDISPISLPGSFIPEDEAKDKPTSRRSRPRQFAENTIHFLNETEAASLHSPLPASQFNMDILIIGTNNNLNAPKAQLETWASHPVRRHFFLATENDDPDPSCHLKSFGTTYIATENQCKHKSPLKPPLYPHLKYAFAQVQWVKKKANPVGWFCAMRRPSAGLAKVVELYKDNSVSLPDYLIIADDDTYMNLDHLNEYLLNQPYQLELKGQSQEKSVVPMSDVPVAWVGCRVRSPVHELNFTFGIGGHGYMLSKGTIERLMEPLYCGLDNDASKEGFMKSTCKRLTSPNDTLIREDEYYKPGMSLMDVWGAFNRGVEHFCLHADWIFAYFLNFYHVSRHVVNGTSNWFDDNWDGDNPNARLHALMASQVYSDKTGFCLNEERCGVNETICHKMNETSMKAIHDAYVLNITNHQ